LGLKDVAEWKRSDIYTRSVQWRKNTREKYLYVQERAKAGGLSLAAEKLGEGAKGFFIRSPFPYKKLPQAPTPNPLTK
jgi:hypothetical protein